MSSPDPRAHDRSDADYIPPEEAIKHILINLNKKKKVIAQRMKKDKKKRTWADLSDKEREYLADHGIFGQHF